MGYRGPGEAGPIAWRRISGLQRCQGCALYPARVSRVGPGRTMDRRDFLGYPRLSCSSIGFLLLSSEGATYIVARGFNPGKKEGFEEPITRDVIATHDTRSPVGRKRCLRPDDAGSDDRPGYNGDAKEQFTQDVTATHCIRNLVGPSPISPDRSPTTDCCSVRPAAW